jgi:hypothetical protein
MTTQAALDEQKLSLIEIIVKSNDLTFLNKIEDFIIANLPCPFPIMTDEEYANRIEQALKEVEEGKGISIEELEEEMKNW